MGLDLILLPFDCDVPQISFSHTILNCERRSALFERIESIEAAAGEVVPDTFSTYLGKDEDGDTCYGVRTTTPYGDPLKYVTAHRLLTLRDHEGVQDNEKNRAIWAYLEFLDGMTKVALFWH